MPGAIVGSRCLLRFGATGSLGVKRCVKCSADGEVVKDGWKLREVCQRGGREDFGKK